MKILLVNSQHMGGVEYYRMMMPNQVLAEKYPEYEFTTVDGINRDEMIITSTKVWNYETKQTEVKEYSPFERPTISMDDFLKEFDLIYFCRAIDNHNETTVTDRIKRLGIPFGLDLDDYWELPEHHVLYNDYKKYGATQMIIQAMKDAQFVTCTTPILAKEIERYNKNVYVIENGIDDKQEAWQPDYSKTDKLRFGFYQGSTHLEDMRIAAQSIVEVFKSSKLKDKFQIILSGFIAEPNEPSVYIGYERLITDSLKHLDPEYAAYLMRCTGDNNENYIHQPYWRLWGTHVDNWGYTYNFSDVSLIPLIKNKFNRNKSELKLIEAGIKGKAAIVSNVNPYKLLATDKNSFLVEKPIDFYNQVRYCIKNRNDVYDRAQQLREDVLAKYTLSKLTDKRKELYDIVCHK